MTSAGWTSLLWFVAIVAMIPAALWLLKRGPLGGTGTSGGAMRQVSALPLAANQRLVVVEVGAADAKRWLVLGVTPQSITTLHTMAPQADVPAAALQPAPFAHWLAKFGSGSDRAA